MSEIAITTSGKWFGNSNHRAPACTITREITGSTTVAIMGTAPIDVNEIKHLKGIVRLGVGYDNVPQEWCRKNGIALAYTPNAPSQSVAEHALALMLAALRFRDREHPGKALSAIRVGLIGRGRIGKRFAALLYALGVQIMAVDPVRDTTFDEIHEIRRCGLTSVLSSCDVVSLHVPRTDKTVGMIDRFALARMHPNGILINTARGGIVDELDLLEHLSAYPDFTAALDVFGIEPYGGPLLAQNNCICTPHVAAMTASARDQMEHDAINAAVAIIHGQPPEWSIPEREPWQ